MMIGKRRVDSGVGRLRFCQNVAMGTKNAFTVEPLPFPVSFGDIPVLQFKAEEQEIIDRFGPAHHQSPEDDIFGEPGPCVYWAFKYSCGLEIVITYYFGRNWVKICADEPEVEHILRHLKLSTPSLWRIDQATPEEIPMWLDYFRKQGWDFNAKWDLWRQDDNGHKYRVEQLTSEREASCLADEFERKGHKQTYWVERSARDRKRRPTTH